LPYNAIIFLQEVNARSNLLHHFPLVHVPSINCSSKSKLEIIAIACLLNSFSLFIYNGVNLPELNSQPAASKPLVHPKPYLVSIPYLPSETHPSCLCSSFNPFSKGGTLSVFNTENIWRARLVLVISYSLPEFTICIMVPMDP
jgi:hypothetical protein